jgi:dihydroflavonol-4-reductase
MITKNDLSGPISRTVLVTGANGFVGSNLVRDLIANGHHVKALIRPRSDRSLVSDLSLEWIEGDLDNTDALASGCQDADWIVHVAGRVNAPDAEAFNHANHVGTANLMEVAFRCAPQLQRFVYISSLAAGGPSQSGNPRQEDDADHPVSDYGHSKLAGERAAMSFSDRLPVVSLRPPAVYGPGDSEILGFFKTVSWHLKPVFGRSPAKLSMVHVDDLVAGINCALVSPEAPGEVFYIAEEQLYTISDLLDIMQAALDTWAIRIRLPGPVLLGIATLSEWAGRFGGFTPSLNRNRAKDFLQKDWTCSVAKAQRRLGFQSSVSFVQGAEKTVAWYRAKGWL